MSLPVGTVLRRREQNGGIWDTARVVGAFDAGEVSELVLAPDSGFGAPITADGNLVWRDFELLREADGTVPTWETPSAELEP